MIDLLNWGLRTGVVITGLIGLVLLLRRPFARFFGAEATFLLWSLPALRLFMPNIHLPVHENFEILPFDALSFQEMEMFMSGMFSREETSNINGPSIIAPVESASQFDVLSLIIFIWIAGGLVWLSYHLTRHYKFTHLLKSVSSPADISMTPTINQARELMGLKRNPKIMTAPKTIGPLVSGILNPLVIMPKNFTTTYSNDAQLFALCHEFSHIKRRDVVWVLALLIFRALHWYNPLVHYAARKFRIDQEAACDAHTLSKFSGSDASAHQYALTLLMSEQAHEPHSQTANAMPALSLAMNDTRKGE